MNLRILYVLFILILFYSCNSSDASSNNEYLNWNHYLGDPSRSHFSSLTQIDTNNIKNLELAWSYKSGGLQEGRTTQIQTNPLIIDNILYGVNASMEIFAINADTGGEIWKYSPSAKDNTGLGLNRGLSYWKSDVESDESRLFFASGFRLYAVSTDSGKAITTFGDNGSIDLREGLGRETSKLAVYANTPGAIYNNLLIMGTRVGEGPGSSPGHIRAYNVLTGAIEWIFHTIPQPGEFGYESWPKEAYKTVGGANSWSGNAVDYKRGIVYFPTGSAAFDWYGGDRHGKNLFANSLLAINANTGERLWHYQFVHHDLWDRDLPAPPNLFEMKKGRDKIPAVAQVTKSGHVFVFNRVTGEPLFPIEEKAYPNSKLEGEYTSPTQPLPTKPAPFARQILTEADLYAPNQSAFVDDFIDKDQNIDPPTVLDKFKQITSKGQFIPIDTTGVLLYPGADGGAEWGGAAMDPSKGIMYVNSNEMAWIVRMKKVQGETGEKSNYAQSLAQIHCARCHGGELQGLGTSPELKNVRLRFSVEAIQNIIKNGKGAMPGMPNLSNNETRAIAEFISGMESKIDHHAEASSTKTLYAVAGFGRFKDNRGFPVMNPPWGTLNAIDLNTGEYLWKVPFGHEKALNDPKYPVSGLENYGGPVVTESGVLFIAATKDEKFRGYSMESGKLLWETDLPAGGYATPATYAVAGKQYVVIACGGGKMGTASGDEYRAYALPD